MYKNESKTLFYHPFHGLVWWLSDINRMEAYFHSFLLPSLPLFTFLFCFVLMAYFWVFEWKDYWQWPEHIPRVLRWCVKTPAHTGLLGHMCLRSVSSEVLMEDDLLVHTFGLIGLPHSCCSLYRGSFWLCLKSNTWSEYFQFSSEHSFF